MVRLSDVEMGVCAYLDGEVVCKMEGLSKWMAGAGLMAVPRIIERKYDEFKPMLVEMGVSTEDGLIDLDKAQKMLLDVADKYGNVTQSFGGAKFTFNSDDIRKMMSHIRSI